MRTPVARWMAVVASAVLTGCAAQGSGPAETPARTPPVVAAPASPSPEEMALDAYRGMWDVVVEGSHEGAVGHPDLDEYATGQALELTTAMLRGVHATGEPRMNPEAAEESGNPPSVSIKDCIDDSEWTVPEETTDSEDRSGRRTVTATAVSHGERWLVEELWLEDYGSC